MDMPELDDMTPPPSTQVPKTRSKGARTPTPPISHISTPPPTIEQTQSAEKRAGTVAAVMTKDEISSANIEELRAKMMDVQALLQEAKTSSAHYKLQYQMLCQESAAAIERMQVEARMAQHESEVIHFAEQARVAATPVQRSPVALREEGVIKVDKDLYQRILRELNALKDENVYLHQQVHLQEKAIQAQEFQVSSLTDNITLLRDRIRSSSRYRSSPASRIDSTPRSNYSTPHRGGHRQAHHGGGYEQPFAALLQASEMASQQQSRPHKRSHTRGTHSMSSLPATPQHHRQQQRLMYHTPQVAQRHSMKIPSTAPVQRTGTMRAPDVYSQPILPVSHSDVAGHQSDGTVSASDHGDDSEAETDIIEPFENDTIVESQASMTASQMLRTSQDERSSARSSFKDSLGATGTPPVANMARPSSQAKLTQTKLFGAVRKPNVDRSNDEPPAKRARTGESVGVGLGIEGVDSHR